jgi:hypothetical protein
VEQSFLILGSSAKQQHVFHALFLSMLGIALSKDAQHSVFLSYDEQARSEKDIFVPFFPSVSSAWVSRLHELAHEREA